MNDLELWKITGSLILLFTVSAGLGAGVYIAQRFWRFMTGYDEQRLYLKQRKCEHVWILTCRLCGLRKVDE
jgi:hypothetical protein